jgi:hypothetical protein
MQNQKRTHNDRATGKEEKHPNKKRPFSVASLPIASMLHGNALVLLLQRVQFVCDIGTSAD